jgi:hypothetical protein
VAATAGLLARASKELLIGEPAQHAINASIVALSDGGNEGSACYAFG